MKKIIILLLMFVLLAGCAAKPDNSAANIPTETGTDATADAQEEPAGQPEEDLSGVAEDDAIIIDNKTDTLIYEDEYCSVTVKWINDGGMTASVRKKTDEFPIGFYLEDVTMNGHPVSLGTFSNLYYNDKKFEGIGICALYPNGNEGLMTLFGPSSKSDIDGWQTGESLTEMSFTLRVINLDTYPEGSPNVSEHFTLRKAD